MCLDIKFNDQSKVASKDITCYKVVRVDKHDNWYAVFWPEYLYKKDEPIVSKLGRHYLPTPRIEEGMHSVASLFHATILMCVERNTSPTVKFKVVKCIIPKGSTYYKGKYGSMESYASDTIIMTTKPLSLFQRLKQKLVLSF